MKPTTIAFLFGLSLATILGNVIYIYEQDKKENLTLSFRCPSGTKTSSWTLVVEGDYAGELYKRCNK